MKIVDLDKQMAAVEEELMTPLPRRKTQRLLARLAKLKKQHATLLDPA